MPRDPAVDVGPWLGKARMDLRAAAVDMGADPPLLADATFHCQQAAEKAIKGLLVLRDTKFRKIHDIRVLGDLALRTDPDLEALIDDAAELTEYTWLFRCPGDLWEPPVEEVREALGVATTVVETVESLLGAETTG